MRKAEKSDLNHFFSVCHVQEVIPITFLSFVPNQKKVNSFFLCLKKVIEKSVSKVIPRSD